MKFKAAKDIKQSGIIWFLITIQLNRNPED